MNTIKVGDKYNWINQNDRLVYIGKSGAWYQFAKIDSPDVVWCEVLNEDLRMLELTADVFTKAKEKL